MVDKVINQVKGFWPQLVAIFFAVWWAATLSSNIQRIASDVEIIKISQTEALKKSIELEVRVVRLESAVFPSQQVQ